MEVVVAAAGPDCPAHLALLAEGIEHRNHLCEGKFGYADLLAELWEAGTGFVLVEHDVVPWPGAVGKLIACPEAWCVHGYPMNVDGIRWTNRTLGCVKFSAKLTRATPEIAGRMRGIEWGYLDRMVVWVGEHHRQGFHEHTPQVAHCRATAS
jgi:hypothetical protein